MAKALDALKKARLSVSEEHVLTTYANGSRMQRWRGHMAHISWTVLGTLPLRLTPFLSLSARPAAMGADVGARPRLCCLWGSRQMRQDVPGLPVAETVSQHSTEGNTFLRLWRRPGASKDFTRSQHQVSDSVKVELQQQ